MNVQMSAWVNGRLGVWWRGLTSREQLYLLGATAAVLLYVLLMVVWRPLAVSRSEMAERNVQVARQLQQVQVMVSELQQLDAGRGQVARVNMNQIISSTTQSHNIRPTRIQPNSRGETQIRFDSVGFAELMRWLHQVEGMDGVRILEVSINQGDRGGTVRATVRLG